MMIVNPSPTAVEADIDELSLSRTSLIQDKYNSREVFAIVLCRTCDQHFHVAHFGGKMLANMNKINQISLGIAVSDLMLKNCWESS